MNKLFRRVILQSSLSLVGLFCGRVAFADEINQPEPVVLDVVAPEPAKAASESDPGILRPIGKKKLKKGPVKPLMAAAHNGIKKSVVPSSRAVKSQISLGWRPDNNLLGNLVVRTGGFAGTSSYWNVRDFHSKWLGKDINDFWNDIVYPRDTAKLGRDFEKLSMILRELGLYRTNPRAIQKIVQWRDWRLKELSTLGRTSSFDGASLSDDPEKKRSLEALLEFKTEFARILDAKNDTYAAFAVNDIVRQTRLLGKAKRLKGELRASDPQVFTSCTMADKNAEDGVANPRFCPQTKKDMASHELNNVHKKVHITENVWTDLKVFYNEELNQTHKSLLSKILCPHTIFGRVFAERMVYQPTYDIELLRARQAFVRALVANPELYKSVCLSLSRIGAYQTEIIEFIHKAQEMLSNKDLYLYPTGHFWIKNVIDKIVEGIPSTGLKNGYERFLRSRSAIVFGFSSRIAEEANDLVSGLGIVGTIGQEFYNGYKGSPVQFKIEEKDKHKIGTLMVGETPITVEQQTVLSAPQEMKEFLNRSFRPNIDYSPGLNKVFSKIPGKYGRTLGLIPSILIFPKSAALNALYCSGEGWNKYRFDPETGKANPGPENTPLWSMDVRGKGWDGKAILWTARSFAAIVLGVANSMYAWSTVRERYEVAKKSLELARLAKKMAIGLSTMLAESRRLISLFNTHEVPTAALTLMPDLHYILGSENKDLAEVVREVAKVDSKTDLVTCLSTVRQAWPARQMFSMPLEALAQIDALTSFATLVLSTQDGKPNQYHFAEFVERPVGQMQIDGVWFPYWAREIVVPSDIALGGNPEAHNLMVGGRNGGGKSSYLRAVTWAILFAHVSGLVPCNGQATFGVYDYIDSQIQIGDDPAQNRSSHQKQSELIQNAHRNLRDRTTGDLTSKIMALVNGEAGAADRVAPCRLVVIDECFKGTSVLAGAALAFAYFKEMASVPNNNILCSTHSDKIVEIEKYCGDLKFAFYSVLVEPGSKRDTHKIVLGKPNPQKDSMGIEVAEALGADQRVIDDAKQIFHRLSDEQASAEIS